MTLILKNIAKIFGPNYNNLDAKFWVQKLLLKKKFNKNSELCLYIRRISSNKLI